MIATNDPTDTVAVLTSQQLLDIEEALSRTTPNTQPQPKSPAPPPKRTRFSTFQWNDLDTLITATRVALSITLASLLTFSFPPQSPLIPHENWIMITAGVVAWTPALDTGTAIKKAIERVTGTAIGAALALAVGHLSLALFSGGSSNQAIFLAFGLAVDSFLVPFVTMGAGYKGSYASVLACITFGIVILGFYSDSDEATSTGLYRTANIAMGCVVTALSVVLVKPTSTRFLLQESISKQAKSTIISAKLVLTAAQENLSGVKKAPFFGVILTQGLHDNAYEAYNKCMEGWKKCREIFPRLKWDPVHQFHSTKAERVEYEQQMGNRLSRIFRIQTTVILIDMIVRFGGEVFGQDFSEPLHLLKDIGERIEVVLDITENGAAWDKREKAAQQLAETDLVQARQLLELVQTGQNLPPRRSLNITGVDERMPPLSLDRNEQGVLLCLLIEQLVIRCIHFHFSDPAHNTTATV